MTWVIVGLGNPGDEYKATRHNAGRMAVEFFGEKTGFREFREDKKAKAHVAGGMVGKTTAALVLPDTLMNKSGAAVTRFVKSQKAAERMIVVYDDLDLPLGAVKLSYDRGSGGHRGLDSIMRAVKTRKFTRVRIGISPATSAGKLKKPAGEKEVIKFILTKFKSGEMTELKKIFKEVAEALRMTIEDGPAAAMNTFNSR